jgi:hypothetical protein
MGLAQHLLTPQADCVWCNQLGHGSLCNTSWFATNCQTHPHCCTLFQLCVVCLQLSANAGIYVLNLDS